MIWVWGRSEGWVWCEPSVGRAGSRLSGRRTGVGRPQGPVNARWSTRSTHLYDVEAVVLREVQWQHIEHGQLRAAVEGRAAERARAGGTLTACCWIRDYTCVCLMTHTRNEATWGEAPSRLGACKRQSRAAEAARGAPKMANYSQCEAVGRAEQPGAVVAPGDRVEQHGLVPGALRRAGV